MKILVTGANGFIGKALIERLTAEGMPVRAAVRTPATASVLRTEHPQVSRRDWRCWPGHGMARCAGEG